MFIQQYVLTESTETIYFWSFSSFKMNTVELCKLRWRSELNKNESEKEF